MRRSKGQSPSLGATVAALLILGSSCLLGVEYEKGPAQPAAGGAAGAAVLGAAGGADAGAGGVAAGGADAGAGGDAGRGG